MNPSYPCLATISPEREREIETMLKSITETVLDVTSKIGHSVHATVHAYPDRHYAVPDTVVFYETDDQLLLYDTFGADTTDLFTKTRTGSSLKDRLRFTDTQVAEIAAKLNPALEELAKISIELDCTVSIMATVLSDKTVCEQICIIPKDCFSTKLDGLDGFLAKSREERERHWQYWS